MKAYSQAIAASAANNEPDMPVDYLQESSETSDKREEVDDERDIN